MLADPLTKALPAPMLESHKLALGLNYQLLLQLSPRVVLSEGEN